MTGQFRLGVIAVLLTIACCWAGLAQDGGEDPKQRPELTAEQKAKLEERDRYGSEAIRLHGEGKFNEAIEAAEKMLSIEREIYGDVHEEAAATLDFIAGIYKQQKAWDNAIRARRGILIIKKKLYGEKDWRVTNARLCVEDVERLAELSMRDRQLLEEADRLNSQVQRLWREHKSSEALPLAQRALAIRKEILGEEHPATALSYFNLAAQYEALRQYAKAESLNHRAMEIRKRVLGEQHPAYAMSLNNLGALYYVTHDYAQAESFWLRALEILKEHDREEQTDYARCLKNLSKLYTAKGDYAKAEQMCLEAIEIEKESLGEGHPDHATNLCDLVHLYCQMGEHEKAEPLCLQAVDIVKKALGESHPRYASTLSEAGRFYSEIGDFAKSESMLVRALEINREVYGDGHFAYATNLGDLASLYVEMGEYAKAEPLYLREIQIEEKVLGKGHTHLVASQFALGWLYDLMGEYAKAEPLYLEVRDIYKQYFGEESPYYGSSLSGLGLLYESMGEYAKAEPLLLQALEIRRRLSGERTVGYAVNLINLASLYRSMSDHTRAVPLLIQACDIYKHAGEDNRAGYARSLNNLAFVYREMGEYAKALPLFLQSNEICAKTLGEEHPNYATSLENLATAYRATGEYAKAERSYLRVLEIRKQALGEEHPTYASGLTNLAFLYYATRDFVRAEALFRRALEINVKVAQKILPWSPEARAVNFVQKRRLGRDPLLSVMRRLPDADHREAYSAVWATRSLVTRCLGQRRRSLRDSPEGQRVYERLCNIQQQLAQLTLAMPRPETKNLRQRRLAELNERKEQAERELLELSEEYVRATQLREAVNLALANAMPPTMAMIDIIQAKKWIQPREDKGDLEYVFEYEAFVVRPTNKNNDYTVAWVHLGPAAPIDDMISQWREEIVDRDGRGLVVSSPDDPNAGEQRRDSARQRLRRLIWDKLETHLKDVQTVVIIPDGALTRLPWAALPGRDPGTVLLEDYAIATAENGQQLYAWLTEPELSSDGLLLVGGVDYDRNETDSDSATTRMISADPRKPRIRGPALTKRPSWPFLPGTAKELRAVEKVWPSSQCLILQGTTADELAMRQSMPNCRYIHLATHGFFADEQFRSMFGHDVAGEQLYGGDTNLVTAKRASVTVRNPLILSGVVLAGANLPAKTDELGLPTGEDGILTAEEVVNLDLRNTELVVLSACETGLGKVAGGEGVYGLTRAFHLAGARNVIASLWKVDDQASAALMRLFYYKLWAEKKPAIDALREAQLALYRNPGQIPALATSRAPGFGKAMKLVERAEQKPGQKTAATRLWAAFMLSGVGR